jgi:hypothetical protein
VEEEVFMDPVTIATAVITILSPYLKDAGKQILETAGQIGVDKAKGLLGWLKERFAGDPVATSDLSRFEADPVKFEPVLQSTVTERAQADPQFAAELQKRLDEGPDITVFQRIKEGKNVIGIDAEQASGRMNVKQEADKVENITGVRIRKAGG